MPLSKSEAETIQWALGALAHLVGEVFKLLVAQTIHVTAEIDGEDRAIEWGEQIIKKLDELTAQLTEWNL